MDKNRDDIIRKLFERSLEPKERGELNNYEFINDALRKQWEEAPAIVDSVREERILHSVLKNVKRKTNYFTYSFYRYGIAVSVAICMLLSALLFVELNKYQPQQGENITDANIPLIRLSEAYLNAAEAAVQTGDNAKAVKYLNSIVQRANPENSVEGKTLTLENVLDERRKELVAEGHRMYDVIRNGMTVKRIDVKDSDINKTKHNTAYMEYDWNFHKILLPIPKKEMDANPNMKQNPGYVD